MRLKIEDRYEYLNKVYASWLGKIIGVRLGSPVENWSHEQIMEKYPDEEGYLVDYDLYAADDDINGPLFFVRALLDYDEISAENIGNTVLNYLQEYKGFFWWGGVGVSTEHTAYENLKNGIKAPASGSMATNGKSIAEQIGGQIFSDCWGYVAGYDPVLAKKLATMASSVTHDGCGIEGGIFVAVAIALAMVKDDIHEVIDEALEYLDKDLEYYRVAKDILRFYKENDDWEDCLQYIHENYGYDKYPGVCHIIPNMALMIMAMSYGDGDFSKTLVMLNRCGWDTDCNCGNVGSILGALVGLKGIDEKWITPINDIINASSAIGYLNIQTVSDTAVMFAKLAYKLQGMDVEYPEYFGLPYATKGIRCDKGEVCVKDGKLSVDAEDIYRYVYYRKEDLYDARYDPQFSPVVSPGDRVILKVESTEKSFTSYVEDCEGNEYENRVSLDDEGRLIIDMPYGKNMVIHRIGLKADHPYAILNVEVKRQPKLDYDFEDYPIDHYGPRYEGDFMNNIRGFVEHSGNWSIDEGLLCVSKEHALISSGCYGDVYHKIEWSFIPEEGQEHYLVFDMRGYLDRKMIGIRGNELVLVERKQEEKALTSYPLRWEKGKMHTIVLEDEDDHLFVSFDEKEFRFERTRLKDLFGFGCGKDCVCRTLSLKAE